MGGDVEARYNLGAEEEDAGNMSRAAKHWMIGAMAGDDDSLDAIRECFMHGDATRDDFEKALHSHKESKDEEKSIQRFLYGASLGLDALAAANNQSVEEHSV